ncbi:MAG: 1-acyl-sn-glycerol-3-phosphate acyltransferase, partial [Hyphomicrobiales bacterium]|nr:1-acyl-sn-glycerol-3-phosphate acyltransferase [Hyphomicrobiales bacterium]
ITCGTRAEARGLENVPKGGFILASKHQSFLEILVIVVHADDFAFAYKRELGWIPLFGWYLVAAEQLSIDRARGSSALPELARKTGALLRQGRQLLIFPEGTRRAPGAPPRYKYGVTHLYRTLDATVVPVAVNTGLFWPRRKLVRRPGVCTVEYLPPIAPGLSPEDFSRELQSRIESASARLTDEALARDPSLAAAMAAPGAA